MSDRSVTVFLKANVDGLVAGYEKARIATGDLAKSTETASTTHKQSWDKAGTAMLVTGAVIAAGVGAAVMAYTEFDHTMSLVKANIDDKSVPSMQRLAAAAMEAGKVTEFSATAAAEAEVQLAKVGVQSAQITGGALVGVLALAAATEIDLPTAASIAAAAMNQFHLSAAQIPHVADLLASAANHALGGVVPLAEALKFSGVVASQFGISIDTTVGVLTMFAQAGITGTMAGTGFRMMLVQMVKPTDEAKAVMEKYGIATFDTSGKFVGMAALAGELHTKLSGLTDQEREHALVVMFGTRALADANILYAAGAEGVKKWTDTVNQQGFAEMQASTKLNNLAGDMQIFGTSVNVALIKEGSAGNGVLRDMAQFATGAVNAIGDLPAPVQAATFRIAALAAGALLVGGAFITLTPKFVATKNAISDMGLMSGTSGTALRGLGTAAMVAAVALPLVGMAGDAVRTSLGAMAPGANEAATELLGFATTGKAAGDSAQLINNGFGDLGKTLYNVFSTDMAHNADAVLSKIGTVGGIFGGTQTDDAVQFFKTLDTGLTKMATDGHAAEAATLFNKVVAAAKLQGISVSQLADALPAYSAQVAGAGKAAATTAQSVDDLARSDAKSAETLVTLGGQAGATGSAMRILGAGADAAATAVKDLAKSIQTDMDAASKAFAKDTDVLGSYDPKKQADAVAAAQDTLNKALKSGSGVADAQNALTKARQDQAAASLESSYKTQIALGNKFATDIAAVTAKGLDPNVIAKLLQEGPAKAEPALQAMLSGNSSKMIAMVNDGEKQLAAINQRVIENARLTSMAVNSQSDQMSKDFSAAMQIDNAIATSGGKATVASLAASLHLGAGDVKRVAAEFGIGIAEGVAGGVTPAKSKIDELQAKIDSIKQKGLGPGISANSKAAQTVIKDLQDQIDALRQKKPPPLDANSAAAKAKISGLQAQIDAIKQKGLGPGLDANSAAAKAKIADLQRQIDALKGKTVAVEIQYTNSGQNLALHPSISPINKATGGPIDGPGTGTSDSVPFMGSNGEHVLTADDVSAAGGHAAIFAYRKSLHAYAGGGPIIIDMPNPAGIGAAFNTSASNGAGQLDVSKLLPTLPTGGGGGFGSGGGSGGNAANKAIMQAMATRVFGWGNQFGALDYLMMRESGYNNTVQNPTSSAYGMGQFLDSTWAGYGPKTSDVYLQSLYTEEYIKGRYGDPNGAAAHERAFNWYGDGTAGAAPGWAMVGEKGKELVYFYGGETVIPNHDLGGAASPVGYAAGTLGGTDTAVGQQYTAGMDPSASAAAITASIAAITALTQAWKTAIAAADAATSRAKLIADIAAAITALNVATNAMQAAQKAKDTSGIASATSGIATAQQSYTDAKTALTAFDTAAKVTALDAKIAADQAALATAQQAAADREAAAQKLSDNEASFEFDHESAQQQLADIGARMRAEQAYSDTWMTLLKQRETLQAQVDAAAAAAAAAAQKLSDNRASWAFDHENAQQQLADIQARMAAEQQYSDLWMADAKARETLQAQIASAAAAADAAAQAAAVAAAAAAQAAAQAAFDAAMSKLTTMESAQDTYNSAVASANATLAQQTQQLEDARTVALATWAQLSATTTVGFAPSMSLLITNAKTQISQFTKWMDQLAQARASGLSEAVITSLGLDQGPQALAQLQQINKGTADQFTTLNALVAQKTVDANTEMVREKANMLSTLGQALLTAQKTAADTISTALTAFNAQLAKAGMTQGETYAAAIAQGLLSGIPAIIAAAQAAQAAMAGVASATAAAQAAQAVQAPTTPAPTTPAQGSGYSINPGNPNPGAGNVFYQAPSLPGKPTNPTTSAMLPPQSTPYPHGILVYTGPGYLGQIQTADTPANRAMIAAEGDTIIGGYAGGGWVGGIGGPTSDSNLMLGSRGEFVVNAAASAANAELLTAINNGQQVSSARSAPTINVAAPQVHVYVDGAEFKGMVRVEIAESDSSKAMTARRMVNA